MRARDSLEYEPKSPDEYRVKHPALGVDYTAKSDLLEVRNPKSEGRKNPEIRTKHGSLGLGLARNPNTSQHWRSFWCACLFWRFCFNAVDPTTNHHAYPLTS